jgi:hypothetical protein
LFHSQSEFLLPVVETGEAGNSVVSLLHHHQNIHCNLRPAIRNPLVLVKVLQLIRPLSVNNLQEGSLLIEMVLAGYLNKLQVSTSSEHSVMATSPSLADVIIELGYNSTATAGRFKDLLLQFPKLSEEELARLFGTVSQTHSGLDDSHGLQGPFVAAFSSAAAETGPLSTWNLNAIVEAIQDTVSLENVWWSDALLLKILERMCV